MTLILASQSPARRRLLKRLGLHFRVKPAHVDEAAVQRRIKDPRRLVRELARMKAEAVKSMSGDAIVIGSDQILVFNGKIFGKPHTEAKACAQLKAFSGHTISLMTAVCILDARGKRHEFTQTTRMKFRRLSGEEIDQYVRYDQPLACAGSFKFESRGIGLFEAVRTDDPTAIEGLPLLRVAHVLRGLGF